MRTRKTLLLILAGAFGVLSSFAAVEAHREYTAYTARTAWSVTDFTEFSEGNLALSHRSNQAWLDGCLRAVTSIEGRLLYGEKRARLLDSCERIVSEITDATPRNAYAWYLQAYLAHEARAAKMFNAALLKSYATGPTEQWIAELRVPLAERGFELLKSEARAGHQRDLGLLVESRRGVGSIARRYIRDPAFRGRITDVVETLPQDAQQRFLGTLKGEVARFQNGG